MPEEEIIARLFDLQDVSYRDFQSRLMPNVDKATVIGVSTPELRALAKVLGTCKDAEAFLQHLPHRYFEENQLHAFLIARIKDYGKCIEQTRRFLPFIDNWATCDQLTPTVFRKHKQELLAEIKTWLTSKHPYTVRFGIGMLMRHFLDEDYSIDYPLLVGRLRSEEYYINMMIAWYFATALAKQYKSVLPLMEQHLLDTWTHNKAIQKARESFRLTPEQKNYLKSLKT